MRRSRKGSKSGARKSQARSASIRSPATESSGRPAASRISVELVRARESGEQRGEIGPLGRPPEPKVTERLTDDTLEEAGQAGRPHRIACRHDRPPILAAYYTARPARTQRSECGTGEFLWGRRGASGTLLREGGTHGYDPARVDAATARDARRRPGRDVRGRAAPPRLGRDRQRGARPRARVRRLPVEPGRHARRGARRAGQRVARRGGDAAPARGGRPAAGGPDPEAARRGLGREGFPRRADR